MTRPNPTLSLALLPALLIADGCSGGSDDLARLAEDLSRRQEAQQKQLVDETRKLSESSRELVESDAAARKELVEFQSKLQTEIQAERRGVDDQREKLDDERRDIEASRHRDPLIAAALVQAATLLVAALPVVVLICLFRFARGEPPEAAVGELLLAEFTAERPVLLPGPVFPPRLVPPPDGPRLGGPSELGNAAAPPAA